MNLLNIASLVNMLGFAVGIAMYLLIAAMVLRNRQTKRFENVETILLVTATLGTLWNAGEFLAYIQKDLGVSNISPWIPAISFSALGFLPSLVVHSAQIETSHRNWLKYLAYSLSTFATVLHFNAAFSGGNVPSAFGLQALTAGAIVLAACSLIFNFRQTLAKKGVWASALLVFAVSSLHLSNEGSGSYWYVEMIAHQSSLVLALTILYQNYRFAFGDLFLKRAFSLILLTLSSLAIYLLAARPILQFHEEHGRNDVQAVAIVIGFAVLTALAYPSLRKFSIWLVDKLILRRGNFNEIQTQIAREIDELDSVDRVISHLRTALSGTLTASSIVDSRSMDATISKEIVTLDHRSNEVTVRIDSTEIPHHVLRMGSFSGGRRLLSAEIAFLENVAFIAARRIDQIRGFDERVKRETQVQEMGKLASEAQLTALRAQINPHFLFNSLTTIGYLITEDPAKANDTLLKLTRLLRSVLTNSAEFCSLEDELKLIESYLDIEKARFEEKLQVEVDISDDLRSTQIPALILQPLVENAVKHGISENRNGGKVRISAESTENGLVLTVWDSGSGATSTVAAETYGFGLRNIEQRLANYFGKSGKLIINSSLSEGTTVEMTLGRSTK